MLWGSVGYALAAQSERVVPGLAEGTSGVLVTGVSTSPAWYMPVCSYTCTGTSASRSRAAYARSSSWKGQIANTDPRRGEPGQVLPTGGHAVGARFALTGWMTQVAAPSKPIGARSPHQSSFARDIGSLNRSVVEHGVDEHLEGQPQAFIVGPLGEPGSQAPPALEPPTATNSGSMPGAPAEETSQRNAAVRSSMAAGNGCSGAGGGSGHSPP